MHCDACGRPLRHSDASRCAACGLDGLCSECLAGVTREGCPDTMRYLCVDWTPFRPLPDRPAADQD